MGREFEIFLYFIRLRGNSEENAKFTNHNSASSVNSAPPRDETENYRDVNHHSFGWPFGGVMLNVSPEGSIT